jgi:hypothetical protein
MNALVSRLLLALASLVGVPVVYILVFMPSQRIWREVAALHVSNIVTGAVFAVCWTWIWSGQIVWTRSRRRLTALAVLWSIGVGTLVGGCLSLGTRYHEVGVLLGGLAWVVSWLASTALIWRETAAERIARLGGSGREALPCPQCGYNLTGLREARCPECGTQYTLDQLLAALREQSAGLGED